MDGVDAARLWAASGAQWLTAPGVTVPVRLVERVVELVRGLDERIAAPHARLAWASTAEGVGILAERAASVGLGPSGSISSGGGTRLLSTGDGWLAVSLARETDIDLVPAWLEVDDADCRDHLLGGDHWEVVTETVRGRGATELVERAVLLGLPCAAVGETESPPVSPSPVVVERLVDRRPGRLDGLVVLNLASLWAGPLAADVLARLGARVITVESVERPDGARATLRFFESLHGRTESVALALRTDVGRRRLAELVRRADVVIEGSRPRALAQLGIDAAASVRSGVRLWLSITAHGRAGAAGERVGFGDDAAAAGGLVGWVDGAPTFLADAIADPLTGLTAAAAVVDHVDAGGGSIVDLSLARTAASCAGGERVAPSGRPSRPAPRRDPGAPLPLGRDTESVLAGFGIS